MIYARDIVDDDGEPLTVDGWTVHGVARANNLEGELLAEWSTTPTGEQGHATVSGRTVRLFITPEMSSSWDCDRVVIQAKLINPINPEGQTERIINEIYDLDREVTPAP